MKIFLTGITGFLGAHIARECINAGYEIIALCRGEKPSHLNGIHGATFHKGDLSDAGLLMRYIQGCQAVINCAAHTGMSSLITPAHVQVNVQGVRNLIAASKASGIKRFIHISTANTVLPGTAANPSDESLPVERSENLLPYIRTKIEGESILLDEFENNGFPVVILNPTFILGPGDHKPSSGMMVLAVMQRKLFAYPSGGKNIVDVRDVAKAAVVAITKGTPGEKYLLANINISYRDMFRAVALRAGIPVSSIQMPYLAGRTAGIAGTIAEYITGKASAINHKTAKLAFQNHYYTAAKAKQELGFDPRPVIHTINDTVDWLKHEYLPRKKS